MNDFNGRVKYFQNLFGLNNWTIEIQEFDKDVNVDFNAKTLADPRYNKATMAVGPHLLEHPEIQEEIIIHELIHIVMALYDYYVDNLTKDPEYTDELMFIARENSVSSLTAIIMRIMEK